MRKAGREIYRLFTMQVKIKLGQKEREQEEPTLFLGVVCYGVMRMIKWLACALLVSDFSANLFLFHSMLL